MRARLRPVYNGPLMGSPLSGCALQCTILVHFFRISLSKFIFFHAALFSRCTFINIAPFPCCIFCVVIFFMLYFFSCCSLFMYCTISCCTFTRCNNFVLYTSFVALFACCNFFLLHFAHIALFPKVQPGPPQTFKIKRFARIMKKPLKFCCNVLHVKCLWGLYYAFTISILCVNLFYFILIYSMTHSVIIYLNN